MKTTIFLPIILLGCWQQFHFLDGKLSSKSNILLLPYPFMSHVLLLAPLTDVLINKGHHLYIALPRQYGSLHEYARKHKIDVIPYEVPEQLANDFISPDLNIKLTQSSLAGNNYEAYKLAKQFTSNCVDMVYFAMLDSTFTSKVRNLNFSFVLVDKFPLGPAWSLLPFKFSIKYGVVTSSVDFWSFKVPWNPATIPNLMTDFTEKMNFAERFQNVLLHLYYTFSPLYSGMRTDFLVEQSNNPKISAWDHLDQFASLLIVHGDHLINSHSPGFANHLYIGPATTKPVKPLPKIIKMFLDQYQGFILVSFGSVQKDLPSEIDTKLAKSFQNIKDYGIIIRHDKEQTNGNLMMLPWLPQNDLLGHPKIKLFITHCGLRGYQEGVYHGVPMIGFPLFAEQPFYSSMMESRGQGIKINPYNFTVDELTSAIREVLDNPAYAIKVRKDSNIMRNSMNNASETVAHWVEHVIKFGDEHLMRHELSMPWYQYLMLDILFVLISIFLSLMLVFVILIKLLMHCLSSKGGKQKPKSE